MSHNISQNSQDSNTLVIAGVKIGQDAEGRYCLNDCHKASKMGSEKRPNQWLRNAQTQDLIAELTDAQICASPVSTIKGGVDQGTYVVKELVYAYAMWISPSFNLQVIRAYDDLIQGKIGYAAQVAKDPMELALFTIQTLKDELEDAKPKALAHDRIADANGTECLTDAAKSLQVKPKKFFEWLRDHGWIFKRIGDKEFKAYSDKIVAGYLVHKEREIGTDEFGDPKIRPQVRVTKKGLAKLAQIFSSSLAAE